MNYLTTQNKSPSLSMAKLMALAVILMVTACSPKPSAEETAAQTKAVAEKAAADATSALLAAQAEEKAKQEAVIAAAAEEKAKQETMAAAVKKEVQAQQRAAAKTQAASKPAAPAICANCGVVLAVNMVESKGQGTGVGAVAGGVVGGLIGNQISKNSNNQKVATGVGAVGGALIGHQIEKSAKKTISYNIVVQMDNGTTQTISQATDPVLVAGQKVKIESGAVVKN